MSRSGPRPRPRPEPPRPTLHWSQVFWAQPSLDDLTNLIIADTPSPGQSASDYLDVVVIKFNDFLFSSLVINYWSNQSPAGRQAARSQHWWWLGRAGLGETCWFNLCSRWDNIRQARTGCVCVWSSCLPRLIGKILFYMLIIYSLSLLGCNYKI